MTETRAALSNAPAGAWWRAAAALAWVGGVALQLQQAALWPGESYRLIVAAALGAWLIAWRLRSRIAARVLLGVALVAAGFAYAGWRADARLADALAPEWEGCDIELVGVVDEMPQVAEDGEHFAFVVESARALGRTARELKRVKSLDAAAGRPLDAAVAERPNEYHSIEVRAAPPGLSARTRSGYYAQP